MTSFCLIDWLIDWLTWRIGLLIDCYVGWWLVGSLIHWLMCHLWEAGISGVNCLVKCDVADGQSTKMIASLCRQQSLLQLVHVDRVDCLQAWSQLKSVCIFVCRCRCWQSLQWRCHKGAAGALCTVKRINARDVKQSS